MEKYGRQIYKAGKFGYQLGRNHKARRIARQYEADYGREVADAIEIAIRNGRDYRAILEQADRAKAERAERDKLLANPPPLHGSATWASHPSLRPYLKARDGFDTPSSIFLGTYDTGGTEFVHWDGDGHLLTVAPTRSGKAQTMIIPNLLRYRGSAVVFDPKGELYEETSAWRANNVGPVYRWAPFDDGNRALPRHAFNPLTLVNNEFEARALAEQLFPADPRASAFFAEDAIAITTALILFIIQEAAPPSRYFGTVQKLLTLPLPEFREVMRKMASHRFPSISAPAHNVLGKSGDRGLSNLRDTINAKMARFSASALLDSMRRSDFTFEGLKDKPATVYIDVPFDMVKPYAPVLRIILKAALDAMVRNKTKPAIPVLFVLDEFLQLGTFDEFRDAIRTHAGAGVRLWFFLQDIAGIEEHYPDGWKPFFNCAVRQFFGISDPFTAELVGKYLGVSTVAWRTTNAGANVSAQAGPDQGSAGVTFSSGESVQFAGRPLMTPDEVMAELSGWQGTGWRKAILDIQGTRPFIVNLVAHSHSATCRARVGTYREPAHGKP